MACRCDGIASVVALVFNLFFQHFLRDKAFSFPPELVSKLHHALSSAPGDARSSPAGQPLVEQTFVTRVGLLVGCGPMVERSKVLFNLHTTNAQGKVSGCWCGGHAVELAVSVVYAWCSVSVHHVFAPMQATLDEVKLVLHALFKGFFSSPALAEVFPHSTAWQNSGTSCETLTEQLVSTLYPSAVEDPSQHVVCPSSLGTWLAKTPLAERLLSAVFACMFLHGTMPIKALSAFLGLSADPETGKKTYDTLLVPEVIETTLIPPGSSFKSSLLEMPTAVQLNSSLLTGTSLPRAIVSYLPLSSEHVGFSPL